MVLYFKIHRRENGKPGEKQIFLCYEEKYARTRLAWIDSIIS